MKLLIMLNTHNDTNIYRVIFLLLNTLYTKVYKYIYIYLPKISKLNIMFFMSFATHINHFNKNLQKSHINFLRAFEV